MAAPEPAPAPLCQTEFSIPIDGGGELRLHLVTDDITTVACDAIVNAANEVMLGGGGVDGAIHRAAGPALLAACRRVPRVGGIRCPTGEARLTLAPPGGFADTLAAMHVIHTAGPDYRWDGPQPEALMSCYSSSLRLASENGFRSLAFPSISTGIFDYPKDEAAALGAAAILSFAREQALGALTDVTVCLWGAANMALWSAALCVALAPAPADGGEGASGSQAGEAAAEEG